MRTIEWRCLAVLMALCTAACGEDEVGAFDGAIEDCDERTDEDCEGSVLPPEDDASVDERAPRADASDDASDEDVADAMPVDEQAEPEPDAEVDENVDESVDPEPDAGPDASDPEPDAGPDADVPDPIDCRDYTCGFGTCDIAKAPTTCDCVTGYLDEGAGCIWTGAIADQDLNTAAQWEGQNMVFEAGVARFESEGTGRACELGVLEQTLQMPTRAASQPFVIELDVLTSCESADPEACPALQVELGSGVTRLVAAGGPGAGATPIARKLSACVGSAGYGEDVQLRVRPGLAYQRGELPLLCESATWPALDRITIRAAEAGECPAFDKANGTLASSAGWSLTNATVAGNSLLIEAGGRAEMVVSIAEAREGQFFWLDADQSEGDYVDVLIDGLTWARLPTSRAHTMCMPFWAHGGSHRLTVIAASGSLKVDTFELRESLSDCGDNSFDYGFDDASGFTSWSSSEGVLSYDSGSTGRGAVVQASTTLRAATRFGARVAGRSLIASARYQPARTQDNVVDYAIGAGPGMSYTGSALQSYLVCLPDAWEHQLATLRLDVTMTPRAPATTVRMYLDDLYATTTELAGCP
jgi:hypothetical protein